MFIYLFILKLWFKESHPDVEAQQVADHSRHGGQDDDPSDVVDQGVHSQTQQSKRSIQLLEQVRARADVLLEPINCFELQGQQDHIIITIQRYPLCNSEAKAFSEVLKPSAVT